MTEKIAAEQVRSGSFCDEALAQARKTAEAWREAMPVSGLALERGLSWLAQAQVLRLDNPLIPSGAAQERKVATLNEYGWGLDVPWPVTAVEYEHGGVYDVTQDYTRALSTRRIALCVTIAAANHEDGQSSQAGAAGDDWGSLLIWPISYFDEKREWEFAPGVVIVPRAQGHLHMALAANAYLAVAHRLEQRLRRLTGGAASADEPMTVIYQEMFPELCVKLGPDHAKRMIRESSMDPLWVVLGCFSAMGCDNVVIDKHDRTLHVLKRSPQAEGKSHRLRLPLDPFRGRRTNTWRGRGMWTQQLSRGVGSA